MSDFRRRGGTRRRARGRSRPCRGRRAPRRCPRRGRGPTRLLTSPSRPRRRGAIQDRGATASGACPRGARPRRLLRERGTGVDRAQVVSRIPWRPRLVRGLATGQHAPAMSRPRVLRALLDRDRAASIKFLSALYCSAPPPFFIFLHARFVATRARVLSLAGLIAISGLTPTAPFLVVVGQWGGTGGAICEDHLDKCALGPWNVKCSDRVKNPSPFLV